MSHTFLYWGFVKLYAYLGSSISQPLVSCQFLIFYSLCISLLPFLGPFFSTIFKSIFNLEVQLRGRKKKKTNQNQDQLT